MALIGFGEGNPEGKLTFKKTHQLFYEYILDYSCGGSLISHQWILSVTFLITIIFNLNLN